MSFPHSYDPETDIIVVDIIEVFTKGLTLISQLAMLIRSDTV